MTSLRRMAGCLALAALAAGCSDAPPAGPRLYPVLDGRGLITYTDRDPQAAPATSPADPGSMSMFDAEARPDPAGSQYDRDQAELRRRRDEQARLDRQEAEANDERLRILRREEREQERQASRERSDALAERRRATLRNLQSAGEAEAAAQGRATAGFLKSEGDRLRQEAGQLGAPGAGNGGDIRPNPITIP